MTTYIIVRLEKFPNYHNWEMLHIMFGVSFNLCIYEGYLPYDVVKHYLQIGI